jgi:8-oxo-dGTP pyrophosphatase MutT (NUDIX family)
MSIEELKNKFSSSLPGETAHQKMAPTGRPLSSFAKIQSANFKESGVAVVLFENFDSQEIVLIQRPLYDGSHSGQVSFPGGKKENVDDNLFFTAIRECQEEVGISLNEEYFLGKLTPVFIPVSNFHVEAYTFYLPSRPNFIKDEREVEEIFTIKLDDLLDDSRIMRTDIEVSNKLKIKDVPYFNLENKIIWGATALILNELKELIKL